MRRVLTLTVAAALAASALPLPALAQAAAAAAPAAGGGDGGRYDPAPWWMRAPIIASTGYVQKEVLANRAGFNASFQGVEKTAADATRSATDQVRELMTALAALGPSKVRVTTAVSISPIYEQYRDKDGTLIPNQRADKIDKYQANVTVMVEVKDLSVLERAYALTVAARPTSAGQVYFSLQPDNETRAALFTASVADATSRARQAAEAAGARLGPVRLIDPTGRACDTDVLVAGAPRGGNDSEPTYDRESRAPMAAPPPPPPPPPPGQMTLEQRADQLRLPLQPPLQTLESKVCVVFSVVN
jgi:uncharacterized protein YggE